MAEYNSTFVDSASAETIEYWSMHAYAPKVTSVVSQQSRGKSDNFWWQPHLRNLHNTPPPIYKVPKILKPKIYQKSRFQPPHHFQEFVLVAQHTIRRDP